MFLIRTLNISCHWLLSSLNFLICSFLIVFIIEQNLVLVSSALNDNSSPSQSGLCENRSISCSHQISGSNISEDACKMIYHRKNSSVCENSNILKGNADLEGKFGTMNLRSYVHRQHNHRFTGLNISFSNIKWNRIYMRFIGNQIKQPSLCREFQVEPDLSSSLSIFFDCLWSELKHFEFQTFFHFEYQAIVPSGETYVYKYIFFVPNIDYIDETRVGVNVHDWEVFLIVDVSGTPARLVLHIQVAPKSLGIRGYKVDVLKTFEENTWVIHNHSIIPQDNETEIRFVYDTKLKFGKYKFNVVPIHPNCSKTRGRCKVSQTPEILIVEMTEPKLLTGIVVTVILIPILLMAYFIWKRQCDVKEPGPTEPPRFLLMYKPVSIEHVKVMMELHKYFTRVCQIRAMLDQFGIPESASKDPQQWYTDAFKEADYIGIFASPETTPEQRAAVQRFNRYLDTERIAEYHMNQAIIRTQDTRCKFFSILLPGTKWETLPTQAQQIKRNVHSRKRYGLDLWSKFRDFCCNGWIKLEEDFKCYTLPRDLDPLLVLIGGSPQCDRGDGFLHAIQQAITPQTPQLCLNLPPPPPQPPPYKEEEEKEAAEEEHIISENPPLCCNNQSASDLDLVSSRQYLSDMSTASSFDHSSLLGESSN